MYGFNFSKMPIFKVYCPTHPNIKCNCSNYKLLRFTSEIPKNGGNLGRAIFFGQMSNQIWQKNKNTIEKEIINDIELIDKFKENQKKSLFDTNKDSEVIQFIYKLLTPTDKVKCIEKYKEFYKITCHHCNNINLDSKYQCLHTDCTKMCEECYNKWDKISSCPSCLQVQMIECPLCFEQSNYENLTKGNNCPHSICWKCYGLAFQKGKPITSCPICRGQFNKKWTTKGKKITELDDFENVSSNGITYYVNPINNELHLDNIEQVVGTYNETTSTVHLY